MTNPATQILVNASGALAAAEMLGKSLGLDVNLALSLDDETIRLEIFGGDMSAVRAVLAVTVLISDRVGVPVYANIRSDWHFHLVDENFVTTMRHDELADGYHWIRRSGAGRADYHYIPQAA